AAWDLRYGGPRARRPVSPEETQFFGGPRGPQAMPGFYTLKLTVGDKVQEKRFEVRIDPTISVTSADLQLIHDTTIKLRDMQSSANDALRTLDSLKAQLEQIEKTVKDRMPDAPKELTAAITDHTKQVEKLQDRLARRRTPTLGFGGGSELADRLGGLFFTIDGVNAAPTGPQREEFAVLQSEFNEKMAEVNRFLNQTVPQLNETLRRHNAPTVIAGKPIELPR
ncbi:MAG TPA: hypothetical protein VJQ56_09610, partial [Blastocatellia bacterium]|nr:hypothetical protein [Blastocatellia bacterium]